MLLQVENANDKSYPRKEVQTGCSGILVGVTFPAETDGSDDRRLATRAIKTISNSLCYDSTLAFNCALVVCEAFIRQDNELVSQSEGF